MERSTDSSTKTHLLAESDEASSSSRKHSVVVGFDGVSKSPQEKRRTILGTSGGGINDSSSSSSSRNSGADTLLDTTDHFNEEDEDQQYLLSPEEEEEEARSKADMLDENGNYKQTRIQTIMSIVNTMMGTTIVALPFGLAEAGIGVGLGIILLLGIISCFTCLIIVESPKVSGEEFSKCVRQFLGKRVQLFAWAVSIAIILGAAVVYHILMQETLYALVVTIMQSSGVQDVAATGWRREWAALVPWFLYPISNLKDLSALVKMNSIGFVFLAYVVIFIVFHGLHVISQGDLAPVVAVVSLPASSGAYDPLTGNLQVVVGGTLNFASLGGMMMLSFFIHNCIQPIIKNANPATRRIDIMIAYGVAGMLYSIVGVLGYVGFADAYTADECLATSPASVSSSSRSSSNDVAAAKNIGDVLRGVMYIVATKFPVLAAGSASATDAASMIDATPASSAASPCVLKSNFLAVFGTDLVSSGDVFAFSARIALLCQLFTVFPLLLLIIRTQASSLILGTSWPGAKRVMILNFAVMGITFAFAATDLQISEVLRFVGAIAGFVIVFAVPASIDYVKRKADETLTHFTLSRQIAVVLVGVLFMILQFVPS